MFLVRYVNSQEIPQNHNVDAHGQENAQEQRLMVKKSKQCLSVFYCEFSFDLLFRFTYSQEMQENRNVDAHDQRKREIEKQRRKARMRLDKVLKLNHKLKIFSIGF